MSCVPATFGAKPQLFRHEFAMTCPGSTPLVSGEPRVTKSPICRRVRLQGAPHSGFSASVFRVIEGGRAILARTPDLLELAGSVPVPPEARGLSWDEIRRRAWAGQIRG